MGLPFAGMRLLLWEGSCFRRKASYLFEKICFYDTICNFLLENNDSYILKPAKSFKTGRRPPLWNGTRFRFLNRSGSFRAVF